MRFLLRLSREAIPSPKQLVECTYTYIKNGMMNLKKLTNGYPTEDGWQFTLSGPDVNTSALTPPNQLDFGGVKLKPYQEYILCEVAVSYLWQAGIEPES